MSFTFGSRKTSVRICLCNERLWIFAILKKEHNGERTYYKSATRHLPEVVLQTNKGGPLLLVREMVEFIFEWVSAKENTG